LHVDDASNLCILPSVKAHLLRFIPVAPVAVFVPCRFGPRITMCCERGTADAPPRGFGWVDLSVRSPCSPPPLGGAIIRPTCLVDTHDRSAWTSPRLEISWWLDCSATCCPPWLDPAPDDAFISPVCTTLVVASWTNCRAGVPTDRLGVVETLRSGFPWRLEFMGPSTTSPFLFLGQTPRTPSFITQRVTRPAAPSGDPLDSRMVAVVAAGRIRPCRHTMT
jgi:hypothetical protein